jgi:hypothetical protein
MNDRRLMGPWALSTTFSAAVTSVAVFAFAGVLEMLGHWPSIPGSHALVASSLGGLILWRRHPSTWWLILVLYLPVVAIGLTVGAFVIFAMLGYRE